MRRKFVKHGSICFIILFLIVTYNSASLKSSSDGNDTVGWPLTFYEHLGGKRTDPYYGRGLIVENLAIDVFAILALTVLLLVLMHSLRSKWKTNK